MSKQHTPTNIAKELIITRFKASPLEQNSIFQKLVQENSLFFTKESINPENLASFALNPNDGLYIPTKKKVIPSPTPISTEE